MAVAVVESWLEYESQVPVTPGSATSTTVITLLVFCEIRRTLEVCAWAEVEIPKARASVANSVKSSFIIGTFRSLNTDNRGLISGRITPGPGPKPGFDLSLECECPERPKTSLLPR